MSDSNIPRVVLIGKGSRSKSTKKMQEMLSNIEPKQVPIDVLDGVFVVMEDGRKFKIDKKFLKSGIDYQNIGKQMSQLGLQPNNITNIEVIIDLDLAQSLVASSLHDLLDPYFSDNEI